MVARTRAWICSASTECNEGELGHDVVKPIEALRDPSERESPAVPRCHLTAGRSSGRQARPPDSHASAHDRQAALSALELRASAGEARSYLRGLRLANRSSTPAM